MPTLREFARIWFERKNGGLSKGKQVHQNWQTLKDFVFPDLGSMRLDEIRQRDIVHTLDPVWREKHETARRTLGRINEIYELAKVQELVAVNPADFSLKAAFEPYRRQHRHHAALPFEQVPALWVWLQDAPCDEMTRQLAMLPAEQIGQDRCIADVAAGDLDSPDLQCFPSNPEVDLAPDPSLGCPVLAGVPLAFALDLDPGVTIGRRSGPLEPRYVMFTASVFWRRDSVLKSGTA